MAQLKQKKLLSVFTLIGVIILFTVQNYEVVELQFMFWKLEMSRALLLFMVLTVGVAIGWLLRGIK